MLENTDLKELIEEWNEVMEWQDEKLAEMEKKVERIGEILRRTEYKIKHFGEAWPDNV
jgi:hypothetical protein